MRSMHGILDAEDRLITDALCIKCGQALRGEVFRGPCPNCGHSISDSVHGDFLIDSPRAIPLALAASIGTLQYPVYVLSGLVGVALVVVLASGHALSNTVDDLFNVTLFGALLSPILSVIGLVVPTRRKRLPYYLARYGRQPYLMVGAAVALAVISGLVWAFMFIPQLTANLLLVLWFSVPGGLFLHGLSKLMSLVPERRMATRCNALLVLLGVLSAAGFAVLQLRQLAARDRDMETGLVVLSILSVLGAAGLTVAIFYLLRDVRVTLLRAAR